MQNPVDGYDVWRWPEFIALAERLGMVLDAGCATKGVTIRVYEGELVTVTQEYYAKNGE